jgi:hypothetical protein
MAGDSGGTCGGAAFIRNVQEIDPGSLCEQHGAELRRRAHAAIAHRHAPGLRLCQGDELIKRFYRNRWMYDPDQAVGPDFSYRGEVFEGIVAQLIVEARVDDMCGGIRKQGVAVGRSPRHHLGADIAATAGAVLHHHRLAPGGSKSVAENSDDNVRRPRGGVRHHDPHPSGRIGLRAAGSWRDCRQGGGPDRKPEHMPARNLHGATPQSLAVT